MEKKSLHIDILQGIIIVALCTVFALLIMSVLNLEGSAKVINYAGVVRGGTELLVKEDLYGNPDLGFQDNLDEIMNGLMNGGSKYELTKLDDIDYQNKLEALNKVWSELKAALDKQRANKNNVDEVYSISQKHFIIADEAVMLAENYSTRHLDTISLYSRIVIVLLAILVVTVIAKIAVKVKSNKNKNIAENQMGNKGFSLVELIVAIAIMAVLIGVIAPTLVGNIEKANKQKDVYNAKSVREILDMAYLDGTIKFQETQGKSAVWVYVTRDNAQFYANGQSKFPVVNGQTTGAQNEFRQLVKDYGIDSDSLKVTMNSVKDTGRAGTDEGWNWYCVYLLSNGRSGVCSGPGNAGADYLGNWTNFNSRIINWADRDKSDMARQMS